MYSEACQTPKIKRFAKIVTGWLFLAKSFILHIWQGSEDASETVYRDRLSRFLADKKNVVLP